LDFSKKNDGGLVFNTQITRLGEIKTYTVLNHKKTLVGRGTNAHVAIAYLYFSYHLFDS